MFFFSGYERVYIDQTLINHIMYRLFITQIVSQFYNQIKLKKCLVKILWIHYEEGSFQCGSRVVVKKIVSWLLFIEPVTVFHDRLEIFFPIFCRAMNAGIPSITFKDGGCSLKVNMLNKCSKQNFIEITLLVIVAPITKVARIFFQISFSWFRRFDKVQISNQCMCIT